MQGTRFLLLGAALSCLLLATLVASQEESAISEDVFSTFGKRDEEGDVLESFELRNKKRGGGRSGGGGPKKGGGGRSGGGGPKKGGGGRSGGGGKKVGKKPGKGGGGKKTPGGGGKRRGGSGGGNKKKPGSPGQKKPKKGGGGPRRNPKPNGPRRNPKPKPAPGRFKKSIAKAAKKIDGTVKKAAKKGVSAIKKASKTVSREFKKAITKGSAKIRKTIRKISSPAVRKKISAAGRKFAKGIKKMMAGGAKCGKCATFLKRCEKKARRVAQKAVVRSTNVLRRSWDKWNKCKCGQCRPCMRCTCKCGCAGWKPPRCKGKGCKAPPVCKKCVKITSTSTGKGSSSSSGSSSGGEESSSTGGEESSSTGGEESSSTGGVAGDDSGSSTSTTSGGEESSSGGSTEGSSSTSTEGSSSSTSGGSSSSTSTEGSSSTTGGSSSSTSGGSSSSGSTTSGEGSSSTSSTTGTVTNGDGTQETDYIDRNEERGLTTEQVSRRRVLIREQAQETKEVRIENDRDVNDMVASQKADFAQLQYEMKMEKELMTVGQKKLGYKMPKRSKSSDDDDNDNDGDQKLIKEVKSEHRELIDELRRQFSYQPPPQAPVPQVFSTSNNNNNNNNGGGGGGSNGAAAAPTIVVIRHSRGSRSYTSTYNPSQEHLAYERALMRHQWRMERKQRDQRKAKRILKLMKAKINAWDRVMRKNLLEVSVVHHHFNYPIIQRMQGHLQRSLKLNQKCLSRVMSPKEFESVKRRLADLTRVTLSKFASQRRSTSTSTRTKSRGRFSALLGGGRRKRRGGGGQQRRFEGEVKPRRRGPA